MVIGRVRQALRVQRPADRAVGRRHLHRHDRGDPLIMGIRLLMAAQTPTWAGLSDRAYRVLTFMCASALDRPNKYGHPAALYTGGHDALTRQLYGHDKVTDGERQMTKRAIRELKKAGAITLARDPTPGNYPHYRIEVAGIPNQDQLAI